MAKNKTRFLIAANAKLNEQDGLDIYDLKLQKVGSRHGRQMHWGEPNEIKLEKTIMLLGATGSGKTTLINWMVNYMFGVELDDSFRVRLIPEEGGAENQAHSQTGVITSYTIHHQPWFKIPYTLTIVDTPGYGDTGGIDRDKEITKQITDLFKAKDGLDHITAIGFVAQSSLARLTPTQRYIFTSMLSLFSKNIDENIVPLLTFADGSQPAVLGALKEATIKYEQYFSFNNRDLFVNNADNQAKTASALLKNTFWDMGTESFKSLLDTISKTTDKSLTLSKELLNERDTLKINIEGIRGDICTCIVKGQQFETELRMIASLELAIDLNKNHFEVKVPKMVEKAMPNGWCANNCPICEKTCHYSCWVPFKGVLFTCKAFRLDGTCKICPGKCNVSKHKFSPTTYSLEVVTEKRTMANLERRYNAAKGDKTTKEKVVDGLMDDLKKTYIDMVNKIFEAKRGIARIQEIALKPNPLTVGKYIEMLIVQEEQEGKDGYQERIKQLLMVRDSVKIMEELTTEGYEPFKNQTETIAKVKERYSKNKKDGDNECPVM